MAAAPTSVRVRSYNVGFGDCFLLSFVYASGRSRHVLIDFGSTKAATRGPKSMLDVAQKIGADCGGKLAMVVATHRHADHISGFAGKSGEAIAALAPDLVVQPWTEHPDLAPHAVGRATGSGDSRRGARALVSRLSDMHLVAEAIAVEAPRLAAARRIPKTVAAQLSFLGETNIRNEEAVRNLMKMGKRRLYASFGTRLPITRVLPGVGIDVLGPPTLRQSPAISHQAHTDPNEFWHIMARRAAVHSRPGTKRGAPPIFPKSRIATQIPQEARWLVPLIDRMHGDELLAIVRSLDDALNNTSLILLFSVGESLLLFPGDAQIENWRYALFEAPEAEAIKERLRQTRMYNVGHHGSLNATPKTLWGGFARRSTTDGPDRLATMVSTLAGKHGSDARRTEVPRRALLTALEGESNLKNTQVLKSSKLWWNDVELEL